MADDDMKISSDMKKKLNPYLEMFYKSKGNPANRANFFATLNSVFTAGIHGNTHTQGVGGNCASPMIPQN